MLDLDKIKLAVFDYDDTLCIHQRYLNDSRYRGEANSLLILRGEDEWKDCLPPEFMKKFISICYNKDIDMGLISCTDTYIRAEAKLKWVYDNYGVRMKNYCVGRQDLKIPMLQDLKDAFKLRKEEILFIDDMYLHIDTAHEKGFISCSPAEIACYIERL